MLAAGSMGRTKAICVQLSPSSDKLNAARTGLKGSTAMPIHPWNVPAVKNGAGTTYLFCILATALGSQILGCASAKVGAEGPRPDGGPGDAASVADGKDGSGPNGKNDGATSYGPCDPFSNAGCASGQKCAALQQSDKTLALGCGDKGTNTEGATCKQTVTSGTQTGDDCSDGLACFNLGGQTTCHRICALSGTDTCPGTETCSVGVNNLVGAGLLFCQGTIPCHALDQTGCPADQACFFVDQKGSICAPPGIAQPGGTCVHANDCAKGATCITINGIGTCYSFCSTASGGTPGCSGGTTCTVPPGASVEPNLGTCQ